jgi:hypothetical protein
VDRHAEGDACGEPRVDECDRPGGADADAEQRPGAEERCGQQAAAEVVRAEDAVVPARRCSPGDRGGPERISRKPRAPGKKLRLAPLPPARREQAGKPQGKERRGEGEERFHAGSLVRLCF